MIPPEAGNIGNAVGDSRVYNVDCNVNDHIVVTSTAQFVGNADMLNHDRRGSEKRRGDLRQTDTRSVHLTFQRIDDPLGRWRENYRHQCSIEIVAEAERHDCTHIAFVDLEQIRNRIGDGTKSQQWVFQVLQAQIEHTASIASIIVAKLELSDTSRQCSRVDERSTRTAMGRISPVWIVRMW